MNVVTNKMILRYVNTVSKKYRSDAQIKRKGTSWFQKLLGWFAKPFNPKYMTNYITTIKGTIWTPDDYLDGTNKLDILETVGHETVHIRDDSKDVLFSEKFACPQILAIPVFIILVVAKWWLFPVALLLLLPMPAWWRYNYEIRAYRMSLLFGKYVHGYNVQQLDIIAGWVVGQLSTRWYYWTWPFPTAIRKKFFDETVFKEDVYVDTIQFLKDNDLLLSNPLK
jgi:hypothetical protein